MTASAAEGAFSGEGREGASSSRAEALRRALAALGPALASFFQRRAGRDAVDDLLQETAFRVERLRASYDAARPPEPWIWRIARLCLLERMREPRAESVPAAALEETPAAAPSPAALAALGRAHEESVWSAIRALEDAPRSRLRTFVALHALEGVPHAALAARFDVTESASKMRVSRGLAALERLVLLGAANETAERRAALGKAWAFVRSHEGRAERAAILAVFGGVDAETRAALGVADAALDEMSLRTVQEELTRASFP